jgi:hypothetical protein
MTGFINDYRDGQIYADRRAGMSYGELAEKYGISRQRCKQIHDDVAYMHHVKSDSLEGRVYAIARTLGSKRPKRAINAMERHGFGEGSTWEEISSAKGIGHVCAVVIAAAVMAEIPEKEKAWLKDHGYHIG